MIFGEDLIPKILAGEKTQTRRPVQGRHPCRYKAGRVYSVQPGRGQHGVARIRVTDVRSVKLGWISDDDAHAEGFLTGDDFYRYWCDLHGLVRDGARVWRITFELVPA